MLKSYLTKFSHVIIGDIMKMPPVVTMHVIVERYNNISDYNKNRLYQLTCEYNRGAEMIANFITAVTKKFYMDNFVLATFIYLCMFGLSIVHNCRKINDLDLRKDSFTIFMFKIYINTESEKLNRTNLLCYDCTACKYCTNCYNCTLCKHCENGKNLTDIKL